MCIHTHACIALGFIPRSYVRLDGLGFQMLGLPHRFSVLVLFCSTAKEKAGADPFITYYPDEPQHTAHYCTALESPENKKCTAQVKWAFSQTNSTSKKAKDFLDEVRFTTRFRD